MRSLKRAVSVISAAALAVSLAVPIQAGAEDEDKYLVTFNWDGFKQSLPVTVEVGSGPLYAAVKENVYNGMEDALLYPAPVDGKAVVGWAKDKAGTEEYSVYGTVEEDLELYPMTAEAVSLGTVELTVEEDYLPKAGQPMPDDLADHISVPADAPYKITYARYYGGSSYFNDNKMYYLRAVCQPKDGKAFNYTYNKSLETVLDIDGAAVNGEKGNVQWDVYSHPYQFEVTCTFVLGEPETFKAALHYGGKGGVEDKTIEAFQNSVAANFLDNSAGEIFPYDENDEYRLVGWYEDPQFTGEAADLEHYYVNKDVDLYAKWNKVIKEVNITIDTPDCGTEVDYDVDLSQLETDEPYVFNYGTTVRNASPETNIEDFTFGFLKLKNQPQVTCDVPGIELDATWIESDLEPDQLRPSSAVSYFHGTMYGENDYMFVINARTSEEADDAPFFSSDLKVYVNGEEVSETSAWINVLANAKKPTTGGVSKLTTITKGSNSFTVVGLITAEHIWDAGVITTLAGCETKGIKTFTCKGKDASYTEEFDASGHRWGEWKVVKPATASEDGLEQRFCENDGEHTETRVIPRTGSVPVNDTPAPAPTGSGSLILAQGAVILLGAAFIVNRKKK